MFMAALGVSALGALIRVVLPQVISRTVESFVIAVTAAARGLVVTFGEDRRLRVIGQEGRERRQFLQGVQPELRQ